MPLRTRFTEKTKVPDSNPAKALSNWRLPNWLVINEVVGTGAYGTVCRARDLNHNKLVAIKKIDMVFADLMDCKRILREVAIQVELNHVFVAKVHTIFHGMEDETFRDLYIVMELCDSDMRKLMKKPLALKADHINTLLYNLLVGISYIHSAGVLHRDLKPANCLVNHDCSVKITDFGLARASPRPTEKVVLSPRAPTPMGVNRNLTSHVMTRWYRAPELIILEDNYTESIDIWSVGCIYAELLSMQPGNDPSRRRPLFMGLSCFPLSPNNMHKKDYKYHAADSRDQLNLIFDLLGTPSEAEIAAISGADARKYVSAFAARESKLSSFFAHAASKNMVDVLVSTLTFSAAHRATAPTLLALPMFKSIRDPVKEERCLRHVKLDFEETLVLEEPVMRSLLLEEIAKCSVTSI